MITKRHTAEILGAVILYTLYVVYLSPTLAAWGFFPDIWLVLVYGVSFSQGLWGGMVFGFLIGLFQDLWGSPFPFHVVSKTVLGVGWGVLRAGFGDPSTSFHLLAIFFSAFFMNVLEWFLRARTQGFVDGMSIYIAPFLKSSISTVLIALPLLPLIRRLRGWRGNQPFRERVTRSTVISSIIR